MRFLKYCCKNRSRGHTDFRNIWNCTVHTSQCRCCTVPFSWVRTYVYGTRATFALMYQLLKFKSMWGGWVKAEEWRQRQFWYLRPVQKLLSALGAAKSINPHFNTRTQMQFSIMKLFISNLHNYKYRHTGADTGIKWGGARLF